MIHFSIWFGFCLVENGFKHSVGMVTKCVGMAYTPFPRFVKTCLSGKNAWRL